MATGLQKIGGLLVIGGLLAVTTVALRAARSTTNPPLGSMPSNGVQPQTSPSSRPPSMELKADSSGDHRGKGEQEMFASTNTSGKVEHVGDTDFQQKVLNSNVPVLVDFYADWCGPCRMVAPVLEELAREVPHARIVKVNVDANPDVAAHYNIQSIPALFVFQNGQPVSQHLGLATKSQLRSMLGL